MFFFIISHSTDQVLTGCDYTRPEKKVHFMAHSKFSAVTSLK